ncbi:MAG TPA: acyl-CoA dehydrogenase family protein [Xanthobacteraceae bacterium]|nr:acyl-CoA dehydrogenase family protein [Xanthobacteraceae bacterium]
MDFALNEEQRHWQMKARKFAEEEIRPISLERDAIEDPAQTFTWDIIKKGSKLGFRTMAVPKEYGGEGTDYVSQAIVMAELARGDSAISKTFSQCWKWSHLIAAVCSDEQKDRFLRPFLADDTYVLGKGGTEPTAGSDNRLPPPDDPKAGHKLRGERHGDYWILNGEKTFIANGSIAKLFFLDVRTNPNASIREGSTLFMVERGTPGFRHGKIFNKRGWRFYQNAELIFENAKVPHANVVGDVNAAGKRAGAAGDTSGGDIFGDLELAANALGVCESACELAMQHARTHKQGGRYLIEQQLILLKLNRMHMLTEALRSFVLRSAWEHDMKIHSPNAALVMNFSEECIQTVTELGLEIHGAAGGHVSAAAEKLVRDSLIWTHLAADNVQQLRTAHRLVRLAEQIERKAREALPELTAAE